MLLDLILMGSTFSSSKRKLSIHKSDNSNTYYPYGLDPSFGGLAEHRKSQKIYYNLVDLDYASEDYYALKRIAAKQKIKLTPSSKYEEFKKNLKKSEKDLLAIAANQQERLYLNIIKNFIHNIHNTKSAKRYSRYGTRHDEILNLLNIFYSLTRMPKEHIKELGNLQSYSQNKLKTEIESVPFKRLYNKIRRNINSEWRYDFNPKKIDNYIKRGIEGYNSQVRIKGYFDTNILEEILNTFYEQKIEKILQQQRRYSNLNRLLSAIKSSILFKIDLNKITSWAWFWPNVRIIKRDEGFLFLRVNSYYFNKIHGPTYWCIQRDRFSWFDYTYANHYIIFDLNHDDFADAVIGMSMKPNGYFRAHNYYNNSIHKGTVDTYLRQRGCKVPKVNILSFFNYFPKFLFWWWT